MNTKNQPPEPETEIKQQASGDRPSTACCASSELIGEALMRCAMMDEGFARQYRQDAENCDQSDHPEIKKRVGYLVERAQDLEKRAAAYREVIRHNAELSRGDGTAAPQTRKPH